MANKDLAVIDHSARAHSSVVGGSTAKRVLNCTASVNHNKRYPNVESVFAAEGTALHEATDFILQGRTVNDTDVIGLKFNGIVITKKLYIEAIEPALRYFDEINDKYDGIDFLTEQTVQFPGIEDAFGTTDIIGIARKANVTILLDWKFGAGVAVNAEENEQEMYYGVGAMHSPATAEYFHPDRPVELHIAQPRSIEGDKFSSWTTSTLQLEAFATDLRHAVAVSQTPDATFKMGSWCKFCPGETGCPAKLGLMRNTLEMSPQEIAENLDPLLDDADKMISLGKAIKDAAHKAAELGATFTNFKLVKKRADREFIDEATTVRALIKAGLKKEDTKTKPVLISPKQAEDALKLIGVKSLPLGPGDKPLFKQESTGTSLAPMSDKRPPVLVMAGGLSKLAERLASR